MWIDTHCHLDARELQDSAGSVAVVRQRAREAGVGLCVLPAVEVANFGAVRQLAHQHDDAYALGIHPLYVPHAQEHDLAVLEQTLQAHANDPRLVAVGEIGLDHFVPELCTPALRDKQWHFYLHQLELAQRFGLPVILHVRRSADALLKGLRLMREQGRPVAGGIAHAFNGSLQQAEQFAQLGFRLGFGGAVTFDTALQLRRLAAQLPLQHLVLETDSPDIPPHWLYTPAAQRQRGVPQGINTPAELPRIAAVVARLRGIPLPDLQAAQQANALAALPRLQALLA
jgi:TatD DNase family protein